MIALLLAVAAGSTAIDAERAFARDARRIGQWAAFRKWADHDAVMFVPQATWARDFLKGREEPKVAVSWRPTQSVTSCDGQVAVNLGPWTGPRGQGTFTTVWIKKKNGWRWVYDGGEDFQRASGAPRMPAVRRASCSGKPTGAPIAGAPRIAPTGTNPADIGRGESGDRTLGWDWKVGPNNVRGFRLFQWTGRGYRKVIDQHITAE